MLIGREFSAGRLAYCVEFVRGYATTMPGAPFRAFPHCCTSCFPQHNASKVEGAPIFQFPATTGGERRYFCDGMTPATMPWPSDELPERRARVATTTTH